MTHRLALLLALIVAAVSCVKPPQPPSIEKRVAASALLAEAIALLRENRDAQDGAAVDRAEGLLTIAAELAPENARVADGLGAVMFRRGDLASALGHFRRSISLEPGYSRPYHHLAIIAHDLGDAEAAEGLLRRSIALNPMNRPARCKLLKILGERNAGQEEIKRLLGSVSSATCEQLHEGGSAEDRRGKGRDG